MNEIKLEKRTPEEMAAWLEGYNFASEFLTSYIDHHLQAEAVTVNECMKRAVTNMLYAHNQVKK